MTQHDRRLEETGVSLKDKQRRIAIIDDEHIWLKTFNRMFKDSDYSVDTYDNPQDFLDVIFKKPDKYVGIICDLKMPHMDGYQVFRAVKQNKKTQNIPFLIVTGALTQDSNIAKVQGISYVSKLERNLREKIFQELIDLIENWPKEKEYLIKRNVPKEKIETFFQIYINYHKFFNDILRYINTMEQACANSDEKSIAQIKAEGKTYITEVHDTCMEVIKILQEVPEMSGLVGRMCARCRTSLTMIQSFQFLITETISSHQEFNAFLKDCKEGIEKIIVGTEQGYSIRDTEM